MPWTFLLKSENQGQVFFQPYIPKISQCHF